MRTIKRARAYERWLQRYWRNPGPKKSDPSVLEAFEAGWAAGQRSRNRPDARGGNTR